MQPLARRSAGDLAVTVAVAAGAVVAGAVVLGGFRGAGGSDVRVSGASGVLVLGARDALVQLVVNLLGNCERHAPGSPVRVTVTTDRPRVVTEVRDGGPGTPPGGERVVARRGTTLGPTGGSGLGPDVSARVAGGLGGTLRVLPPDPDHPGFAVRIELPLAPSSAVVSRGVEVR